MRAHQWTALFGAAAIALTGCERYENAGDHHAKADVGSVKAAIASDENQWNSEFRAKPRNLEALLAHYAPDAYFVGPGMKPASGSAEIRKAYEEGLKDPKFDINFAANRVEVADSGDLATSRGRFNETYTDPATNQPKTVSGSFVTVYKKQKGGSWKAIEDFAVADGG